MGVGGLNVGLIMGVSSGINCGCCDIRRVSFRYGDGNSGRDKMMIQSCTYQRFL